MWSEAFGTEVARILSLMSERPNLKPHPQHAGVKVFDGGQVSVMTGITSYKFADGATAIYGTGREWELTLGLATGEEVHIRVLATQELPAI